MGERDGGARGAPSGPPAARGQDTPDWRDVLWREWRYCEDDGIARLLYDEVSSQRLTMRDRLNLLGPKLRGVVPQWLAVASAMSAAAGSLMVALGCPHHTAVMAVGGALVALPLLAGAVATSWIIDVPGLLRARTWQDVLSRPGMPTLVEREGLAWWSPRPLATEVQAAARCPGAPTWLRLPEGLPSKVGADGELPIPQGLGAAEATTRWYARLRARLDGAALIPALLRAHPSVPLHGQLARTIAEESRRTHEGKPRQGVCKACLVSFERRVHEGPGPQLVYYACRSCGSAHLYLTHTGPIVAVLDASWSKPGRIVLRNGDLYANWLARARRHDFRGLELFDFDRVEIREASDDEVRHFLVDVTSDTDKTRRKRYATMECKVAANCALSENTLAALRRTFGRVEVVE